MESDEEQDEEGILSNRMLQEATGSADLASVVSVELAVDSTEVSLGVLGEKLCSLQQLKLVNSNIARIRDLGTSWRCLQVLWLSRCNVQELDGVAAMPLLRELYAAFNDVADLSPLGGLDYLRVLDVDANRVDDLDTVAYLGMCPKLTTLTLDSNPVAALPFYRRRIVELLPKLERLDEQPVSAADREPPPALTDVEPGVDTAEPSGMLEARELHARELALVADAIKYAQVEYNQDVGASEHSFSSGSRASSAPCRPMTPVRPASAAANHRRGHSAGSARNSTPGLGGARPGTAWQLRPSTATGHRDTSSTLPTYLRQRSQASDDESSSLTFGSEEIFCGNPVQALRRRKTKEVSQEEEAKAGPSVSGRAGQQSLPTKGKAKGKVSEHEELLEELLVWKLNSAEEELDEEEPFYDESNSAGPADVFVVEHARHLEQTSIPKPPLGPKRSSGTSARSSQPRRSTSDERVGGSLTSTSGRKSEGGQRVRGSELEGPSTSLRSAASHETRGSKTSCEGAQRHSNGVREEEVLVACEPCGVTESEEHQKGLAGNGISVGRLRPRDRKSSFHSASSESFRGGEECSPDRRSRGAVAIAS